MFIRCRYWISLSWNNADVDINVFYENCAYSSMEVMIIFDSLMKTFIPKINRIYQIPKAMGHPYLEFKWESLLYITLNFILRGGEYSAD